MGKHRQQPQRVPTAARGGGLGLHLQRLHLHAAEPQLPPPPPLLPQPPPLLIPGGSRRRYSSQAARCRRCSSQAAQPPPSLILPGARAALLLPWRMSLSLPSPPGSGRLTLASATSPPLLAARALLSPWGAARARPPLQPVVLRPPCSLVRSRSSPRRRGLPSPHRRPGPRRLSLRRGPCHRLRQRPGWLVGTRPPWQIGRAHV